MRHRMLLALAVAGVVAACSGPDELLDDEGTAEAQGRFGLVAVSYDHDWGDSGESLVLTSTAQFVRYAAMDREQVSRLLALPLEPERDLPAPDQCRVFDVSVGVVADEALDAEETGSIQLLEAGHLKIETAAETVTLSPRHFPWLLPFISGVVYGEAQSSQVDAVSTVRVQAEGGEAVGAFGVQATSPDVPRLLAVAGLAPAALVPVDSRRGMALRWTRSSDRRGEVTYAELRYSHDKRDLALRCRLTDDGVFHIPAQVLSQVDGQVSLELVRLRRATFDASGLQLGELRVSVRDRLTVEF